MGKFEDGIQELVEKQRSAEAQEILQDLSLLYEQFHCLSRRLIYLITGEEKTRTGLTDFIKSSFIRRGVLCQKEVAALVTEDFDPTTKSKAVSDSLQYLMKISYLEKFWDGEIKKYKYRISRKKRG